MTLMNHTRVTDDVLLWIRELLAEEFPEQAVRYDVAITAIPDGAQEDRWVPIMTLYLGIDGVVPNQDVFGSPVLRPYAVNERFIKDLTRDGMQSILGLRDQLLAERAGTEKPATES